MICCKPAFTYLTIYVVDLYIMTLLEFSAQFMLFPLTFIYIQFSTKNPKHFKFV